MEKLCIIPNWKSACGPFESDRLYALVQDEGVASRKKLHKSGTTASTSSATASPFGINVTESFPFVNDFIGTVTDASWEFRDAINRSKLKSKSTTDSPSIFSPMTMSLSEMISFIRNHLDVPYADDLANRLDYLLEVRREEATNKEPISPASLRCLIRFLDSTSNLIEPDLVLSPSGNVCAEWHKSRKEHLSVEFLPTGQVNYVVFSHDVESPSKTDRGTGIVSAKSLLTKVKPFNVLSWAAY